ncbi:MAG: hypothetical protein AMXMBFR64_20250 [Myxococcales bacterium]
MTTHRPRRRSAQSPEDIAARALRELRRLGRALAEAHGVAPGDPLPLERLTLPVQVALTVPDGASHDHVDRADAAQLVRDLGARLSEGLEARIPFRPGTVYCFFCESPECAHARQPDRTATFRGYTPVGKPAWQTLTNLCIERGDERVDRLFGDRPDVVAVVQEPGELTGGLLPSFGKGNLGFHLLGQVVAGLVPEDLYTSETPADHRVALTVQLLETRIGGARRLRLNLIGVSAEQVALRAADGDERGPAESLRRTLIATRERLDSLGRRAWTTERRGHPVDLEADARPLLFRLRGDLERIFRPLARRTHHAQVRHVQGDRPTSVAVSDAMTAPEERLLWDTERSTVVVLGPKSRAHVFTQEGRHVTSLLLRPGEVDRKAGRARWRPMVREQIASFRSRLEV